MSSELKQLNRSLLRSLMSTGTANLVSDRLEELERDLTRAHEDKRKLSFLLMGLRAYLVGECILHETNGAIKKIDAALSATASPEPAKNTEGAK